MLKSNTATHRHRAISRLLLVGCLIVVLSLFLPTMSLAGPPGPGDKGTEICAPCHSGETKAWQDSPHARMGVTCETCHGPYVVDHPKKGVMQLNVDSSVCKDCHADTYRYWKDSPHAQVGVQCIGCHLSHSQDFRLTDEALCGACHRAQLENVNHSAHGSVGVMCIDCHVSSTTTHKRTGAMISENIAGSSVASGHSFTVVSGACVGCHGKAIHQETQRVATDQTANIQLLAMANSALTLSTKVENLERANRSLQAMAVISLGLGLGIGGMLGIIFMVVVGYISRGRVRR